MGAVSRSVGAEEHGAGGGEPAAGRVHARDLGVLDLTTGRLTPELADGLDHEEHAAHARVAGREPAAVGVGGQRAPDPELPVRHELAAFTLAAEPEGLER